MHKNVKCQAGKLKQISFWSPILGRQIPEQLTVYPSDIEYKGSFEMGLHEIPHIMPSPVTSLRVSVCTVTPSRVFSTEQTQHEIPILKLQRD